MTTQIEIIVEFKTQVTAFFDELIAQFPHEGDLVVMRLYIATQLDITDALNTFIHTITTNNGVCRQAVKDRNEQYFMKMNITSDMDKKYKLGHFKSLWRSGQLDTDDKNVIWSWIDTFIFLADKYRKTISSV